MRHNSLPAVLLAVGLLAATAGSLGCTPRVRIRAAPGPDDTGIRYYRPKPYLRIEPGGSVVTEGRVSTTTPSDEFVAISLEYLPDFSEEYSIDVRPGLGTANVSVGLTDGWNLTSLNQELDSQFDESVQAIADLAKAGTGFLPTAKGSGGSVPGSTQKFVVAATNVPIGYYESVISKDACGKKRLYGWRYVGFLPFSPCPTEMCGGQQLACSSVPSDLFGMVFDNGVMTFKRLDAISEVPDTTREPVSTGQFVVSASRQAKLDAMATAIRKAILQNEGMESKVHVTQADDWMTVQWDIELLGTTAKNTTRERFIKSLVQHEAVEQALHDLGDPVPTVMPVTGLPGQE
ncbi:hypothetical protein Enr13x_71610 [Stieleria neptunia]|uniref:Uncharacterized protein n=1 Tax=Stieleria neptunia TaxID=2527979 RepID=A0A518I2B4_9BACT|nr:hypothetical protein [Stieleria neptunia]QDV47252.1 hypothetical protein Enr13x_71610 [Stieleria neptunia]